MRAPTIKVVAVVKKKLRVPVEVVPGTMSPATEKEAGETADTAPAAKAGKVPKDVLVESMSTVVLVDTLYLEAGWELPTV